MFSVIARDPDGRLKKFLCLNNFSFNSRTSFTLKNTARGRSCCVEKLFWRENSNFYLKV